MSDEHSLSYERKELNKAQNLGIAGIVGALIPIIGLMFGIISLVVASSVKPEHSLTKSKKNSVEWIAIIAIFLSIAAGTGYYFVYHQRQVNAQKQAAAAESQRQAQANFESQQATQKQQDLDNCLNDVNDRIKKATSGRTVSYNDAQVILQLRQQLIEECNSKYSQ